MKPETYWVLIKIECDSIDTVTLYRTAEAAKLNAAGKNLAWYDLTGEGGAYEAWASPHTAYQVLQVPLEETV